MSYMLCVAQCYGCARVFTFNPLHVPSIRVEGTRRPICQACVELVNPVRVKRGLPPIVPLPDAYGPGPDEGSTVSAQVFNSIGREYMENGPR